MCLYICTQDMLVHELPCMWDLPAGRSHGIDLQGQTGPQTQEIMQNAAFQSEHFQGSPSRRKAQIFMENGGFRRKLHIGVVRSLRLVLISAVPLPYASIFV